MKKLLLIHFFVFVSTVLLKAQGESCDEATPFCSGGTYTFPASTDVPDAGTLACLGTSPNPSWYYLNIATSGDIVLEINMEDANGTPQDVDFICYGPYNSLPEACANRTGSCGVGGSNPLSGNAECDGKVIDCSYSGSSQERVGIPNALAGEWYMVLLTNFASVPADITLTQTNSGAGAGTTNCNILCPINNVTANPGTCNPSNSLFSVSGVVEYHNPPSDGTLTITNNINNSTQVFNPPFTGSSKTYTLTGIPSTGGNIQVTATFSSGDFPCSYDKNFNAPAPCSSTSSTNCPVTATNSGPHCTGQTLQLNATNVAGAIYRWSGPNGFTSSLQNPVINNANSLMSGTYYVTAIVGGSQTCISNASTSAAIGMPPTITGNNITVCPGVPAILSVSGASSYTWTPSTGLNTTNGSSVVATRTVTTTYTITGTNSCGLVGSGLATVTMATPPEVQVNSPSICIGDTTMLTATGYSNYSWNPSYNLSSSIGNRVTAFPEETTTYTVIGTGCGSDTTTITVFMLPNATIYSDSIECEEMEIVFTGEIGKAPYTFYFKQDSTINGLISTENRSSSVVLKNENVKQGKYTFNLTKVTDANNCSSNIYDQKASVSVYQNPNASFTVEPKTTDLLDPVIKIENLSIGDVTYRWNFGDKGYSIAQNPEQHTYRDTGSYDIKLFIKTEQGCKDSLTETIFIKPPFVLYIPSAFTPDEDGLNDIFLPKGELFMNYGLTIFDRWGNKLFYSNDINKGWDGKANNEALPSGSYVYVIDVKPLRDKHDYTYRGFLNLLK